MNFNVAVLSPVLPERLLHQRPNFEYQSPFRLSQINPAPVKPDGLVGFLLPFFNHRNRQFGVGERKNRNLFGRNFKTAGRLLFAFYFSDDFNHRFIAQSARDLHGFGIFFQNYRLNHARNIAKDDEFNAPLVADGLGKTGDFDLLANMTGYLAHGYSLHVISVLF